MGALTTAYFRAMSRLWSQVSANDLAQFESCHRGCPVPLDDARINEILVGTFTEVLELAENQEDNRISDALEQSLISLEQAFPSPSQDWKEQ
jgi:hypothetical protein